MKCYQVKYDVQIAADYLRVKQICVNDNLVFGLCLVSHNTNRNNKLQIQHTVVLHLWNTTHKMFKHNTACPNKHIITQVKRRIFSNLDTTRFDWHN